MNERNMCIRIRRKLGNILWITCYWSLIYSMFVNLDSSFAQDAPLRVSESVDSVIADLKSYIPNRMNEADVPGLAIALIRDNKIAWTDGFGVVNRLTGRPVSSKTVFEAASITSYLKKNETVLKRSQVEAYQGNSPHGIHIEQPVV